MPSFGWKTPWLRVAVATAVAVLVPMAYAPAAHAASDTTAPTAPGTPVFSQVTPFAVTLTWQPSTDDVGVTDYLVQRALPTGGNWVESTPGTTTTITITNLTPNNAYTFTIAATDAAGNTSASAPGTVRTLRYTAGPFCSVAYQQISSGGGSFFSSVGMTNLSTGPWQEWTLSFTLAPGQAIDPAWGWQRDGTRWSQTFVWLFTSNAGPLLPNATRTVSFSGTSTGTNLPPTDVRINDHPCGVTGPTVPPGVPGNLTASNVTSGSVSLTWSAATPGTNPISRYDVLVNGYTYSCVGVNPLACLVTGLTPGSVNTFAVRAVDTTGLVGPAATITVQTPGAVAPSPPGLPAVSAITTTSAVLTWPASMPGSAPLAGYTVYRVEGTTETPIIVSSTTTATLSGLTAATSYTVRVRARDTSGVLSGGSPTVTFTTLAPPRTCKVTYTATDWGNGSGFTGAVTIANTGTTAITGWTLRFTFPAGQRVVQGWNAAWTQPAGSADVTATDLGWNAAIQPNATVNIGFSGSYSGTNPKPTAFTLNSASCTVA
jgi:hypothetical protein